MAERAKRVRPDYVARYEDNEHQASYVNGHWYLYRKMPGGQCHQYVGRITENGVCPGRHRELQQKEETIPAPIVLDSLNVTVSEYGFSKAVLDLCPELWKEHAGKRWKDILVEIIVGQSPNSYLKAERNPSRLRVHIGNQRRYLQNQIGYRLEELWNLLGNIYWIQNGDSNGYSSLSSEQVAFCQEHFICLEVLS